MKKITILILTFILSFCFVANISKANAQVNPLQIQDSLKEYLLDHNGNKYPLKDLVVGKERKKAGGDIIKSVNLCTSGYFNLWFEDGCGMEDISNPTHNARRAVICQVFLDISNFINSPLSASGNTTKVNIFIRNPIYVTSNPSFLGAATSFYTIPNAAFNFPDKGGIADGEIFKTIIGGVNSYTNYITPQGNWSGLVDPFSGSSTNNFYHGQVAFNFDPSITWNTDLNLAQAPINTYDLYSIALHEVTHALGFQSLISQYGGSIFGSKYFTRYDKFLKSVDGSQYLVVPQSTSCSSVMYDYQFNPALSTTILQHGAGVENCANQLKYVSGSNPNMPVYTPPVFEDGSSLSHFEDACFPIGSPYGTSNYFVMSRAAGLGPLFTKRHLVPEEKNVLCDIGYSTNATFGSLVNNNYFNYGSGCSGATVEGINDGYDVNGLHLFVGAAGSNITINGGVNPSILSNDVGVIGGTFECLEVINEPSATLSVTSGNSSTLVNFSSSTDGLKLLRYIPVSASGERGNITYLTVLVRTACNVPPCEGLLGNGTFENTVGCGWIDFITASNPTPKLSCWNRYSVPVHILKRSCTSATAPSFLSVPFVGTIESDGGSPNNVFIDLGVFRQTSDNYELHYSIQSLLATPLIPNVNYVLKFKARMSSEYYSSLPLIPGEIIVGGSSNPMNASWESTYSLPSGIQNLGSVSIPHNYLWSEYSIIINTSSTDIKNLILYFGNFGQTGDFSNLALLDNISLKPQETEITLPLSVCADYLNTNLSSSLSFVPNNGVFSGSGVYSYLVGSNTVYGFNASVAGAGNHVITFTYTDILGCVITKTKTITVKPLPTVTITGTTNVCINATNPQITFTGANGTAPYLFTYSVNGGSNQTISSGGSSSVNITVPTSTTGSFTYTLISVSSALGCSQNLTGSATVTVNSLPVISVTPAASTICSGQTVNLTASGANTYTWSPPTGLSATSGTSVNASPTTSIAYTVIGTTVFGCTNTSTSAVNVVTCLDCSGGTNLTGTVSTSPAVGASLRIPNNITISGTVTFTNNNIKILPGVTITVLPTATLNIVGSHLYGCESMWQGIKIQAGGKINIQPYVVSAIVQKTTLIEDATIALDFLPITTLQAAAVLQVNNATFNKNATAIKVQGYSFSNPASIFSVKNSLFTCRQIYNTATPSVWPLTTTIKALNGNTNLFLEPYITTTTYPLATMKAPLNSTFSEKGIQLINVGTTSATFPYTFNSITIGSTTTTEYNVFDYLKVDIHAENSNLKVINSTFQFPSTISNTLFSSMSSPNLGTGIFANAPSGAVYKVDVAGTSTQPNKFYGLSRALHTVKYRDIQFNYNTVRSNRQNAVPMGGYNNGRFGVYMLVDKYDNVLVSNNTIYNIDKGVYLNASISGQSPSVKILTNTFHNNLNTTYGARNSDAVLLENVLSTPNTGGLVWVNSNTIVGNARAITLNNWNRTTIQIKNNGIALVGHPASSVVSHGIALNSCMQGSVATQIYENNISGFSINHPNFKGIALTTTIGNELRCNAVNNTYSGIYFNGNCNPTKTYNNSMENHRYGFVLDNGGIIGQQGTSTTPADNRWLGTWDPTGTPSGKFKNACLNSSTTDLSKMYVRSGATYSPVGSVFFPIGSYAYSTVASPTITLFTVLSPPVYSACATIAAPAELNLNPAETVSAIESTAVTTNNISNVDMQAVLVNQTYRTLDADPTLVQNSASLSTFYDATVSTNTAKLLNVEKAVSDNNTILASTENASVSPQNSLEDSYKLFYDALLNYQNNAFTSSDSTTIYNIASDCPTLQGGVVYQSSALYNLVYSLAEVFENICPEYLDKSIQQSVNESENDPKSEAFQIYPIPNNGEFTLFGDLELGYKVLIKSVEGKIVFEEDIKEVSAKINVKTLLSSGAYSVLLINKEKVVFFEQNIIIVR